MNDNQGNKKVWLASELNQRIVKTIIRLMPLTLGSLVLMYGVYHFSTQAQQQQQLSPSERTESDQRRSIEAETNGLAETFKGVTTNGTLMPNLFAVCSTGVSTAPARQAAEKFLASLKNSAAAPLAQFRDRRRKQFHIWGGN